MWVGRGEWSLNVGTISRTGQQFLLQTMLTVQNETQTENKIR